MTNNREIVPIFLGNEELVKELQIIYYGYSVLSS
jgi:hypothetical protein